MRFTHWLWALTRRLDGGPTTPQTPEGLNLEDMTMSLEDRVAEWPKPYIRQGREEGISVGRKQGIGQEYQT